MVEMLFQLSGGIGLFLLGMGLLTDGLKQFAGAALRTGLMRFTGTPTKAFASGAVLTLLVQSSSATTVALIGLVSAGVMAFPQALGVVLGASLGTTGTGWMVSLLGLKISLGFYALPLVFIGAFLRLLGRGRWQGLGLALAGFGMIFIGIDFLQTGMAALSERVDLSQIPSTGLLGHAYNVLIGLAMTVIMQSSSAAAATTLTALHVGTIGFEQAASIVIGAAIGTTVTGALAAIGGGTQAQRTALAHVLFNLFTGILALVLLPLFLAVITWLQAHVGLDAGAASLAAFHSLFIALGVLLILPMAGRFARVIERLRPESGSSLTRYIDDTLLGMPPLALEASGRALSATALHTAQGLNDLLTVNQPNMAPLQQEVEQALNRLQQFIAKIEVSDEQLLAQRRDQLHALDHLLRLSSRLKLSPSLRAAINHPSLQPAHRLCVSALETAILGWRTSPTQWTLALADQTEGLSALRESLRPQLLESAARSESSPEQVLERLDALRWLERCGYHLHRIAWHLTHLSPDTGLHRLDG